MITELGKVHIKRYLSRQVGTIGGAVALGIGSTPALATDTRLNMEIIRADVSLVTYDFTTDRLIFKAAIPNEYSGKIYEIGLWSLGADNMAGNYGSRSLASFEDYELWSAGVLDPTNARVGPTALRVTAATNGTTSATRGNVIYDFSGHSSSDAFLVSYYVNNPYTASIRVRLATDASNYYQFTISAPQPGYNVSSLSKGAAAVTGTPVWSNITSIQLDVVANAGGAAVVDFDAIRVEDVDPYNPDYILVAREVLSSPLEKVAGRPQEVEFSMGVDI